jgi:hypothetical protein
MRSTTTILQISALCLMVLGAQPAGAAQGYDHFIVGDPGDVSPATEGLLMLHGGGTDIDEVFIRMGVAAGGGDSLSSAPPERMPTIRTSTSCAGATRSRRSSSRIGGQLPIRSFLTGLQTPRRSGSPAATSRITSTIGRTRPSRLPSMRWPSGRCQSAARAQGWPCLASSSTRP